ncbi:MAG: hypothetical protein GX107_07460 [Clostridiales bacterium]|nr:hypothetical protein [Clostridiales bacterium]
MKRFMALLMTALVLVVFAAGFSVKGADATSVSSPTPTIIPDGPTGSTRPTTGPGDLGSTTVAGGSEITTAKPGEPQTLRPGEGDDATGKGTTDGEDATAKPDDSDKSPETGGGERFVGAAVILLSGMAVAACVDTKGKKAEQKS